MSILVRAQKQVVAMRCMPQTFDMPSEADIMAGFPKDMLTAEMRSNIMKVIEHIEASHVEAARAMQSMKKFINEQTHFPIKYMYLF